MMRPAKGRGESGKVIGAPRKSLGRDTENFRQGKSRDDSPDLFITDTWIIRDHLDIQAGLILRVDFEIPATILGSQTVTHGYP
jgi:hypothetical protein